MADLEHRFDWYQATVPAHHELLCRELLRAMGEGTRRTEGPGRWSYKHATSLATEGENAAVIYHGGVNPHPNVSSTGEHGASLATVLRTVFPDHKVSRCDVAIDMRGEGLFDEVTALMGGCGRRWQLKGERILPDDLDDGSTYYLGARTSPLRVRCYEKGKQLFKLTGDPVWKLFFDWTRLELQVRPEKAFKSVAATMEPDTFWGCSPWTRQLASEILSLKPEAVTMKPTRISDQERAMRSLATQYGSTILREIKRLGSPETFLEALLDRIDPDRHDRSAAQSV